MAAYELHSQDVSVALDFARCTLCGSTQLSFVRRDEGLPPASVSGGPFILPISVPAIAHADYKRVVVNGIGADFQLAKTLDPTSNASLVNQSCRNVDLLSLDGMHVAAQQICASLLYVELSEVPAKLKVDIQFEYMQLRSATDDLYFHSYWLLPRCSTSYHEYAVLCSSPKSDRWFPTVSFSDTISMASSCVYRIEVVVPSGFSVICGLPLCEETTVGDGVEMAAKTTTFQFKWESSSSLGVFPRNSFGLFAGEFEFWDGNRLQETHEVSEERPHKSLDDEDCVEAFLQAAQHKLCHKVPITYVTLKGYGFLLEPSNIATAQCVDTYRRVLDFEAPDSFFMLFLPGQPFPVPGNISANIRTQNFIDIKRCTAFTGSENHLYTSFIEPLANYYHGMYYPSGANMIVYSIDVLHSYSDIDHDFRSLDCRIAIAYGLATLFTLKRWVNPSRDMHLDVMLQSYLVDQFVKRNMGFNEYKVRMWARRELFATITEIYGDYHPLCQRKGSSASVPILMADRAFVLKCHLLPAILEALFVSANFLPDNFLVQSLRRRVVIFSKVGDDDLRADANCARRGEDDDAITTCSNGAVFWDTLRDEMVRRYINSWNARPPNRLVVENQLDPNCKLEDILRRGVDHDHLSAIMKQYNSIVSSFLHGTGCPQINVSFSLQLQRKGTSMDHLNFRIDIKPLQPPIDVHKDGRTAYTVAMGSQLAARNLMTTYGKLARILQLDDHTEEHSGGHAGQVLERVAQIYNICKSGYCPSVPHAFDFVDIANSTPIPGSSEAGILRRNMGLLQIWHDPVDLVGRDGNFLMGFGYIGPFPYAFCLGNGPIYDCLDVLKKHCDVNNIIDSYVDNGGTYCGSYVYKNGYELLLGRASLPVASNGGMPYWQIIHQQALMNGQTEPVPMSAGLSKQWVAQVKVDIVEDDGVRENVKLVGDMVPTSYKVNPRAERGRKKVAMKGTSEKDVDDVIDDSNRKNTYVGHYSDSDRTVIEWMKMLYLGIHPELAQLDNRSVVAKICSKSRVPMLWTSVDSGFRLIGRIRRCQSGSMWEQQLLSDNNIYGQIDAAAAMGSLGRSVNYASCDSPVVKLAVSKIEMLVRRHHVHPVVRARCLYSLVCLHNRDPRIQEAVQQVFSNYLSSFSLNNTGANYWHPSESRFMLDFFKALALLRDRWGSSPQMAVDMLAKVLEGMNGVNYLVHATNIVDCCSYLAIPPCALRHTSEGSSTCLEIRRLWQLLWHLFRLDAIPGSGSCNRMLTAAFLRCLSRQPIMLELCFNKFAQDKDIGFAFDFHTFIPLRQNILRSEQAAFELGQTYHSSHVHIAAIESLLRVLMTSAYIISDEEDMEDDSPHCCMRMLKVDYETQVKRIGQFAGIYEAARCSRRLCERFTEAELKIHTWDAFARVIDELAQLHPVLFIDLEGPYAKQTRDLLYDLLRPCAMSSQTFQVQIYIRIRRAIMLLFGKGFAWEGDVVPNEQLVSQHIDLLTSGLSLPRIAAFRRIHGDGASGGSSDWLQVAVEAIEALKELPQARWFINDPEQSYVGYRSLVGHPMWLTKIANKALSGYYSMPMQFKADMALVFKNAKSVNKADTLPYADALFVEEQFDSLWPAIVRTYQRSVKASIGN
ncbi:bromodomain containing protein, putative [Babesia bigemina]|uniref:Bromodomain containing protein, putative n=1 Tax=Babesia bigemina TaxID=5866 RepID=A0A061DBU1_BABBI|nr:bromodomain containing protein, putative [Babesia bigemina]CDR95220.1 bromodomain containing protein, putative [Babesia bigemina]|eukprot:XP_012767406.1 bromodomain containing protein, putative [Babesia bigemina]